MTEFRSVEYAGIKGYIIECRLGSTSLKGPWLTISNWSSEEARQHALTIFQSKSKEKV